MMNESNLIGAGELSDISALNETQETVVATDISTFTSLKHRPGRPRLGNFQMDRPLMTQHRMYLKNFDSVNMISTVAVDAGSIAVGTQSGKILVFSKRGMELKEAYMAHTHKVTDIWIQHNRAIVSTSHDMTIKTKSLTDEDFEKNIEIKGYKEEL